MHKRTAYFAKSVCVTYALSYAHTCFALARSLQTTTHVIRAIFHLILYPLPNLALSVLYIPFYIKIRFSSDGMLSRLPHYRIRQLNKKYYFTVGHHVLREEQSYKSINIYLSYNLVHNLIPMLRHRERNGIPRNTTMTNIKNSNKTNDTNKKMNKGKIRWVKKYRQRFYHKYSRR